MSQCLKKHKCWSDSRPIWYCIRAKGHAGPHQLDESHAHGEKQTCCTVALFSGQSTERAND